MPLTSKCKNCPKIQEIYSMFYTKNSIRNKNGAVVYGSYTGNYFCDYICWLVEKGVVASREVLAKKCKDKPVCDKCWKSTEVSPFPIIYNHKPFCEEVLAVNLEGKIKKCFSCKVEEKENFCEKWEEEVEESVIN